MSFLTAVSPQVLHLLPQLAVPILSNVGMWIAIYLLSKAERRASWWLMLVSLLIHTTAGIVRTIAMNPQSSGPPLNYRLIENSSNIAFAAWVVFSVCLVIQTKKVALRIRRIAELETISASMAQELTRRSA